MLDIGKEQRKELRNLSGLGKSCVWTPGTTINWFLSLLCNQKLQVVARGTAVVVECPIYFDNFECEEIT